MVYCALLYFYTTYVDFPFLPSDGFAIYTV